MLDIQEIQQQVDESVQSIAELIAKNHSPQSKLLPKAAYQDKVAHEIEAHIHSCRQKIEQGLHNCIIALAECVDSPMNKEHVLEELVACFQKIHTAKDLSELGLSISHNISWKQHLSISEKCMESLYHGARLLFEKQHFEAAEKAFYALCSLDPTQEVCWFGLGHSSVLQKKYQEAVDCYCMASSLDPKNVWPHVYAANCFIEIKDYKHAKMALKDALKLQKENKQADAQLTKTIEAQLHTIQHK